MRSGSARMSISTILPSASHLGCDVTGVVTLDFEAERLEVLGQAKRDQLLVKPGFHEASAYRAGPPLEVGPSRLDGAHPIAQRGTGNVLRMARCRSGASLTATFLRQEVLRVVSAGCREATVKGDHAATMLSRETEKITVRDLLGGSRRANFGHCCRRYGVGPELVPSACSSEQQKSVGSCFGRPRTTGQLRADANHSELCQSAGGPALITFGREPLDRGVVMLMLWKKQRNQHVDVQKADHGQDYSTVPSARRSTSATESVGAPGRRGNAGTPRSNRTSAFAIRLSSASTNSSTRSPDWLARSASRSFNAASTVIVAFGIKSLSHDVVRSASYVPFAEENSRQRWPSGAHHSGVGRSTESITSTSTGPRAGSSLLAGDGKCVVLRKGHEAAQRSLCRKIVVRPANAPAPTDSRMTGVGADQ